MPVPVTAEELRAALGVERWIADVLAGAPYPSTDALLSAARDAATPLTEAEVDEAVAHHPRIGEKPAGRGLATGFSAREQQAADADDEALAAALAAGNREYEERFGRVFLIRAAGRSRAEVLAELRRRLGNTPEAEVEEAAEQLRQIMELRLRDLYPGRSHVTTHVLDEVLGRPAVGVPVTLGVFESGAWRELARETTDADGRVTWLGPARLPEARYRVVFDTAAYFDAQRAVAFYPEISVVFELTDVDEHYHVPLLLAPYGYSTYRGS